MGKLSDWATVDGPDITEVIGNDGLSPALKK
jgi:hypothetical protein